MIGKIYLTGHFYRYSLTTGEVTDIEQESQGRYAVCVTEGSTEYYIGESELDKCKWDYPKQEIYMFALNKTLDDFLTDCQKCIDRERVQLVDNHKQLKANIRSTETDIEWLLRAGELLQDKLAEKDDLEKDI